MDPRQALGPSSVEAVPAEREAGIEPVGLGDGDGAVQVHDGQPVARTSALHECPGTFLNLWTASAAG